MKRSITLTLLALMFSVVSFAAVGPITGTKTLCTGTITNLSDTTIGGVWSSTNTSVAVVGSTGAVYGVSSGTSMISYTVGATWAVTTVTVFPTPAAISGPSTVCVGSTITLSDATSGGTWTGGSTSIATVGVSTGIVTGIGAGVTNIYYVTSAGCGAYKTVTVNPSAPIVGPSTVCVGSTISLTDAVSGGSWLTSSTATATVSSGGVVTGMAFGAVTIYYTVGGCSAFKSMTVMPTPSAISGPSSICVGAPTTYTDATSGGSWSISPSIATITSGGIVTGSSAGAAVIAYILSSGCLATKPITITTLTTPITGPSTVCIGSTIALTDATPAGTWLSGNTTIATVSSAGVVTGVTAGVVNIYYSVSGCGASYTVTVTGGSKITGPSSVCVGATIALTDSTSGGTWLTSGTSIATVSSGGVVTGMAAGVVNIYYLVGGCGAFHSVTVMPGPGAISGSSTVCVSATTTYTDATSGGIWSSSNTAIATINPTSGVITGVAAGTAIITYKLSTGCFVTKTITVTTLTTPITGSSSVCIGSTIALTDATPAGTWLSGNTSIATVSSTGVVTGVAAGVVNIYYSVGGCGASKTVTVTGSSKITGPSTVCVGATIALTDSTSGGTWLTSGTATATVSSGGVVTGMAAGVVNIYYLAGGCGAYHTVTVIPGPGSISGSSTVCVSSTTTYTDATSGGAWSSSNTAIATINATSGVITGVAAGTATITYKLSTGCFVTKAITVTTLTTPITGSSTVCIGSTIALTDATPSGVWLSGNTSIATVSSSGIVTGVAAGVVNIYYSVGGCGASKTVTVTGSSKITGPSTVCVGSTIALTDSTFGGTWLTSGTATATVSSGGVVTGVAAGVVNIYYLAGGCGAYHTVTVVPAPGAISGASSVCVGATTTYTDATTGGMWSSSNSSVASVGATSGVVTGVSKGTATITYMLSTGCFVTKTITVGGASVITGPSSVCVGSTIVLTDSTSGGTWLTSSTSTATVSSGLVTGISTGTVNIYYSVGGCGAYKTVTVLPTPTISGGNTICVGSSLTLSSSPSGGAWSTSSSVVATVSSAGVVKGISAGVATVTYALSTGCSATKSVTVNATPSAITGPSTVSVGGTIALTDAVSGGTWLTSGTSTATISSGGVVTGVATGVVNIYYIIGSCAAYKTVTVTPKAPGSISGKITTGGAKGTTAEMPVVGMTVDLKDNAGNVITFTATDGTGTYSFEGLEDGRYVIYPDDMSYTTTASPVINLVTGNETVTGINFKKNTATMTVDLYTTNVLSVVSGGSVSIFPNPTSGTLNIKWDDQAIGTANMVITDVVGREVFAAPVNMVTASGQAQVILSGLKNGLYLLNIKSENVNFSSKLIIQ